MLDINDLNFEGYDFTIKSTAPWVIILHNFLSEQEISSLLQTSEKRFKRSFVVGPRDAVTVNDGRTSTSCMFTKGETWVLDAIESRVAKLTSVPKSHMEPFQLVKYECLQEYSPHFDWFDVREEYARKEVMEKGQRCLTILVYLVEPVSGGGTLFPRMNLEVPPTKGTAVLWFNTDKHGTEDERTEHAGLPVDQGTKVAMNIWVRNKEYK